MRLIDADALIELLEHKKSVLAGIGGNEYALKAFTYCIKRLHELPTVEAEPTSYVNQIRWERDIAIEQLNEIGCQFGQKMDDVKKKLEAEPVVHGEWVFDSFTAKYGKPYRCSRCHEERGDTYNYCPNCGAKMDGGV